MGTRSALDPPASCQKRTSAKLHGHRSLQKSTGSARHTPIAFISYSWDSKAHKTWVRLLAERLVRNGVDVILDQWHLEPGASLTHFMERSIERAEFVLVICTPNYARRSNSRTGGVGYEQQIISGQMALGLKNKHFIPILRRGTLNPGRNNAMPTHLSGIYALDMRREGSDEDFENLVRVVYAEPRYRPPPLGQGPMFRTRREKRQKPRLTVTRLADAELDGYDLASGVVQAEKSPETFHIPSAAKRAGVKTGQLVKLIFMLCDADEPGELFGERMWVKITGRKGSYISGKLMNQPLTQDENGWPLTWGDKVFFLPEHIIDIEPAS